MRAGAAARDDVAPVPAARRRVLDLLSTDTAVDAQHVADVLGLHVSTARFHLDALVAAGHAVRARSAVSRVGRPRQTYRAVARAGDDGHRELLAALVHGLAAEPDGPALARRAGRAWTSRPDAASPGTDAPDGPAVDAKDPLDPLLDDLERLGFAPTLRSGADGVRVEMRACPYLDLAREHPEVACSLHLGLVEGLLGPTAGRPPELVPFATDEHCLLRVSGR